jgi:hypothetical protein
MKIFRWMLIPLVAAVIAGSSSPSAAQRRPNLPRDNISSAGTIKALAPGVMHVENVGGDEWLLRVEASPQDVILTGSALPGFLRPGMFVQFKGLFTNRGVAQEALQQVKIFSPKKTTKLGAEKDAAGPDTKANNFSAFITKAPEEETEPEAKETSWYNVTGVIKKNKVRNLTVSVGRSDLKVELAEDAEILLNINDYRLARVGDEVEFEGWHYPGQKKFVHATRLSIKGEKPFGQPLKKATPGKTEDDVAAEKKKTEAKKKKGRKNNPFPL